MALHEALHRLPPAGDSLDYAADSGLALHLPPQPFRHSLCGLLCPQLLPRVEAAEACEHAVLLLSVKMEMMFVF